MHIHVLGVCGTFMGGIAALAKAIGHRVTGADRNVYPPMSTQLQALGIELHEGFDAAQLQPPPDIVVVGNVMTRGQPVIEALLESNLPYVSGPEWLSREVLRERWVLAVAGTHGKTTTSSLLAWILEHAGLEPGFLIGGIPKNFGASARLGKAPFFVIEADEYDTAFFDKRAKFVHYRPFITSCASCRAAVASSGTPRISDLLRPCAWVRGLPSKASLGKARTPVHTGPLARSLPTTRTSRCSRPGAPARPCSGR
jgi:UDP-N-acetylmuramate: L-alanyl-gamma-D-glutamyl-meso-diaminopimelate ligase